MSPACSHQPDGSVDLLHGPFGLSGNPVPGSDIIYPSVRVNSVLHGCFGVQPSLGAIHVRSADLILDIAPSYKSTRDQNESVLACHPSLRVNKGTRRGNKSGNKLVNGLGALIEPRPLSSLSPRVKSTEYINLPELWQLITPESGTRVARYCEPSRIP
ncbi:hypothetical protein ACJ73_08630 [Blastomyces percursus]|uniref:Uncharacterized protein n=1 Tax=Blastomyces percursus TaxID=1658174 RepID=A0A1J9PTN3_9EURO|nr:hypothetical protein ACJ73_08630 [Blastomyces percursus]